MGLMLWKTTWETGIEAIDAQHQELLRKLNDLFDAIQNKNAANRIPDMLLFLATYVEVHFQEEEKAMEATQFPGFLLHRAIHNDMRNQVRDLLAQSKMDPSVVTESLVQFLVDWLINHMDNVDRLMVLHLKQCEMKAENIGAAQA